MKNLIHKHVLGDAYYFIFGAKKISLLNGPGDNMSKTLTEAEVEALGFMVMWSGVEFDYQSNDEVGTEKVCSGTSGNIFNSNFQSLWLIVEICRSSPGQSDKIGSLERHISKI